MLNFPLFCSLAYLLRRPTSLLDCDFVQIILRYDAILYVTNLHLKTDRQAVSLI